MTPVETKTFIVQFTSLVTCFVFRETFHAASPQLITSN